MLGRVFLSYFKCICQCFCFFVHLLTFIRSYSLVSALIYESHAFGLWPFCARHRKWEFLCKIFPLSHLKRINRHLSKCNPYNYMYKCITIRSFMNMTPRWLSIFIFNLIIFFVVFLLTHQLMDSTMVKNKNLYMLFICWLAITWAEFFFWHLTNWWITQWWIILNQLHMTPTLYMEEWWQWGPATPWCLSSMNHYH